MFVGMRLAKAGWLGGDPERIVNAPVDAVQRMLEYEFFEAEYQDRYLELNKPEQT